MDLANRVALITGGKRIGGIVAEQLARGGADVALVYRTSHAEAEDAAAAVRGHGRQAIVMQADLRDADACARVVDQTVDGLGRLDVLVNMASTYRAGPFRRVDRRGLGRAACRVNLRAAVAVRPGGRAPTPRRLRGGRIVNLTGTGSPPAAGLDITSYPAVLRGQAGGHGAHRGARTGVGTAIRFW